MSESEHFQGPHRFQLVRADRGWPNGDVKGCELRLTTAHDGRTETWWLSADTAEWLRNALSKVFEP